MNELTTMDYAQAEARVAGLFTGLKMSSREIAELTGKAHFHVRRDIEALISNNAIGQSNFGETPYVNPQNLQTYYEYVLDFKATMVLMTGYDSIRRAAVISRWMELEEEKAAAPAQQFRVPTTLAEALRLAADKEEEVQRLTLERDEAIRTKVHISDKKTESAMGTASGAVQKMKNQ